MENPIIIVPKHVVRAMVDDVLLYPRKETGWGLVGIISRQGPIFVCGIIKPTEADIDRSESAVEVGGQSMANAYLWLSANWHWAQRHIPNQQIDGDFVFLHKGHSHPTESKQYSEEDNNTILESVQEIGLSLAIGPLATIETNKLNIAPLLFKPGSLMITRNWSVRLQFYYLDAEMVACGKLKPILVTPQVVDAKDVPMIAPMGWQFTRESEFTSQRRVLENFGCKVRVINIGSPESDILRIQFIVTNPQWYGILKITTPWNYPTQEPTIEVVPITGRSRQSSMFSDLPHLVTGPLWSKGDSFIEIIWRLLARGEL